MTDTQKNAVIFGLANKRSIAWAIAQKLHAAGWRLGITYMNERLGLEAKDLIAGQFGDQIFRFQSEALVHIRYSEPPASRVQLLCNVPGDPAPFGLPKASGGC